MTEKKAQPNVIDVGLRWLMAAVLGACLIAVFSLIVFIAYPQKEPWWVWPIGLCLLSGILLLFIIGIVKTDRAEKHCQHPTTETITTTWCTYCNKTLHKEVKKHD